MLKVDEILHPASCFNKARSDERLFVLLERDVVAPMVIRFWAAERVRLGKNKFNDAQITEALQCADLMERAHLASGPSKERT